MSNQPHVLMVGAPAGAQPKKDSSVRVVATFEEARDFLKKHSVKILIFGFSLERDALAFTQFAIEKCPAAKWVLVGEDGPIDKILEWQNVGRILGMIDNFEDPRLPTFFDERRDRSKRNTKKNLVATQGRLEIFHAALLAIHRAATTAQMEQMLQEALQTRFGEMLVRIRFTNQSAPLKNLPEQALRVKLSLAIGNWSGEIIFARGEKKSFNAKETEFLRELGEAVSLALLRLHHLDHAEMLKAQWQATFDAIPHALCLTNDKFEIIKLNRSFQQLCEPRRFTELLGKNCFEVFFGSDFRPHNTGTTTFSFRNPRHYKDEIEHFEVAGAQLQISSAEPDRYLILIRSITEEVRIERRIFEASKLAELGTIGSSIAHELNNPLGGMLSFLQLILMDIKEADPIFKDVKAMEQAVLRCRDSIQNLLSFARKQAIQRAEPKVG